MRFLIVILLMFGYLNSSNAQLSVYHLLETQYGNDPGFSDSKALTLFNQLDASYRLNAFKLGARVEQFHTSAENDFQYIHLSQLNASFRKKRFSVQAGNYYDMLGRGLLLRAYDVKGAILEDKIYRSRQGFHRDILGANIGYKGRKAGVKVLYGLPLNNQLPKTHPDQRLDKVALIDTYLSIAKQRLGVGVMQHTLLDDKKEFLDLRLSGRLFKKFNYYLELAGELKAYTPMWFEQNYATGLYAALSFSVRNIGVNMEWKDYRNLAIGSGISDPPTLVKEHSYRLLNRSTHITDLFNERGYQLDIYFPVNDENLVTINHSLAQNRFHRTFNFYEIFAEWMLSKQNWNLKSFVDISKDELTLESFRWALGTYYSLNVQNKCVLNLESEFQQIKRGVEGEDLFVNSYLGGNVLFSN